MGKLYNTSRYLVILSFIQIPPSLDLINLSVRSAPVQKFLVPLKIMTLIDFSFSAMVHNTFSNSVISSFPQLGFSNFSCTTFKLSRYLESLKNLNIFESWRV
eukprot:NODE_95_length_21460_cov_0.300220.p18 type:complete len:102 gc:universal NODE_95_length_21460_cov_0.300220:6461-6766(+)